MLHFVVFILLDITFIFSIHLYDPNQNPQYKHFQTNAKMMMSVHTLSIVKIMNVKTLAWTLYVALEQLVRLNFINLFASVHQAYRVTLLWHVRKLVVHLILNVQTTKSVITRPHLQIERNANFFVGTAHVHLVLYVAHQIIEKYVPAIIHFKEMDMYLVQNVSSLVIQSLHLEMLHCKENI